jgi:hypothetical protein
VLALEKFRLDGRECCEGFCEEEDGMSAEFESESQSCMLDVVFCLRATVSKSDMLSRSVDAYHVCSGRVLKEGRKLESVKQLGAARGRTRKTPGHLTVYPALFTDIPACSIPTSTHHNIIKHHVDPGGTGD